MRDDLSTTAAPPCAYCRRKLYHGFDAWQLVQGVIGPRGLVPVEDPHICCSVECAHHELDDQYGDGQELLRHG